MDTGPASLGFDPTFELKDCLFEVGDRGFHLGDAAERLLKVNASEIALATVMSALQACGLAGYRNDGEFSISRPLRDILSASIMINNDRILANAAGAPLLFDIPALLRD